MRLVCRVWGVQSVRCEAGVQSVGCEAGVQSVECEAGVQSVGCEAVHGDCVAERLRRFLCVDCK